MCLRQQHRRNLSHTYGPVDEPLPENMTSGFVDLATQILFGIQDSLPAQQADA